MSKKKRYQLMERVGDHYKDGKRYEPGSTIRLTDDEAEKIKNKLVPLDKSSKVVEPPEKLPLKIAEREGEPGMFDVINQTTGNPINDEPLTRGEVEVLIGDGAKEPESKKADFMMEHRGAGKYVILNVESNEPATELLFKKEVAEKIVLGEMTIKEALAEESDE